MEGFEEISDFVDCLDMIGVIGNVPCREVFVASVGPDDYLYFLRINLDVEFGDIEMGALRVADCFSHFFFGFFVKAVRKKLV